MRGIVIVCVLFVTACTADVSVIQAPLRARVADACADLASLCSTSGNCLPQQAFCQDRFTALFTAEDACKTSCDDVTSCLRTCKATRVAEMTTILATVDMNGDGITGDGTAACSGLDTTCATTGQGCTGGEFFCATFARVSSPCSTQLDMCKAACAPHERTCLQKCRTDYKQCIAGTTTTTTTYNLTYGTTAGSTGTGTVTVNPAGTSCGTNCATYAAGTAVTLTATASTGSSFTAWVGCTSSTSTCTVTMTQARTVTATFTKTTTTTSYTYTTDIAPKMSGLCNGCHSGASAPGNYFTDTYTALFGNGSDGTPNIIAGNANSLFVQKIAGNHHNVLNQYPGFETVARDWVVNNNAVK